MACFDMAGRVCFDSVIVSRFSSWFIFCPGDDALIKYIIYVIPIFIQLPRMSRWIHHLSCHSRQRAMLIQNRILYCGPCIIINHRYFPVNTCNSNDYYKPTIYLSFIIQITKGRNCWLNVCFSFLCLYIFYANAKQCLWK